MNKRYIIRTYFDTEFTDKPIITKNTEEKIKELLKDYELEESSFHYTFKLHNSNVKIYSNSSEFKYDKLQDIDKELLVKINDVFFSKYKVIEIVSTLEIEKENKSDKTNSFILENIIDVKLEKPVIQIDSDKKVLKPLIYNVNFLMPLEIKEDKLLIIDTSMKLLKDSVLLNVYTRK